MPRIHKIIRIAPGIWRDGDQLVAEVRIGASRTGDQQRLQKRWPLGTDLVVMQAWQHASRADLLLVRPQGLIKGSLAADVQTFLALLPEGSYKADAAGLLKHWAQAGLGQKPRAQVTRLELQGQINRWLDAGVSASSCRRRLFRLRKLFQALDGTDQPNPTDGIKPPTEPEREARNIPAHIVGLILECMPDQGRAEAGKERPKVSETKLRLQVMAWTGITPETLRRVRPRDLDLGQARIYLRPRRKGKGTGPDGSWVALLPSGVEALKAFQAAGLLGKSWQRSSMRHCWHRAIARALKAAELHAAKTGDQSWAEALRNLPPRCKPYDLRHSFASEIYRLTGDIRAVAELLQHADLETTKRYTKGAVSERVTAAIRQAAPIYATMPTLSASPAKPRLVRKHGIVA